MFQNDEKLEKGYHEIYDMMLDILYQKNNAFLELTCNLKTIIIYHIGKQAAF